MHYKTLLSGCLYILFFTSCGQAAREQKLADREKQVIRQQQELIVKAGQLALKEAQLTMREKHLDSALTIQDSLITLFPKLAGNWNVSMVCSKATCPGSAVGDTKTEQWKIELQGNTVIAQSFTKKVLSRVYTGNYKDGLLQLTAGSLEATADTNTQINLFLRPVGDSTSMAGKRNITRTECQIVYDLTLKKQ